MKGTSPEGEFLTRVFNIDFSSPDLINPVVVNTGVNSMDLEMEEEPPTKQGRVVEAHRERNENVSLNKGKHVIVA